MTSIRAKLMARTQEHLGPHETVRHVFLAQTGPSPYWLFLTWLTALRNRYVIGAITDTEIVVFRATAFRPSYVKKPAVVERYPRVQLGPCSGLWGRISLAGTTFHVHRRFHSDIAAADASSPAALAPEGWYPDPAGGEHRRYWDGSAWTDRFEA
jgi:hypothetical protein